MLCLAYDVDPEKGEVILVRDGLCAGWDPSLNGSGWVWYRPARNGKASKVRDCTKEETQTFRAMQSEGMLVCRATRLAT